MVDSSGHVNGTHRLRGGQTGFTFNGATGYHWPFTSPTAPPAKPERIVQANSSSLNPNSGNYTVTLRYRTTKHFGNIVQKGQAGSSGGYFKIENPNGKLTCVYRGTNSSGKFLRKAGRLADRPQRRGVARGALRAHVDRRDADDRRQGGGHRER